MFLIPFLFMGVLGLIVWALVEFSGTGVSDSAVTIARRRFASGEISSDEFQRMRHNLGGEPARPGRGVVLLVVPIVGLLLLAMAGSAGGWAGGWNWGWGNMGGMMGNMGGMMGSGRDSSLDSARQGSANETVVIKDFAYSPGNLQVPVGAKVTWTNRDSAPHSATAKDGSWDTGVLREGQSATLTFDRAGTYDYYCSIHPTMKAKLVVQ
jgi:plastocyanin